MSSNCVNKLVVTTTIMGLQLCDIAYCYLYMWVTHETVEGLGTVFIVVIELYETKKYCLWCDCTGLNPSCKNILFN